MSSSFENKPLHMFKYPTLVVENCFPILLLVEGGNLYCIADVDVEGGPFVVCSAGVGCSTRCFASVVDAGCTLFASVVAVVVPIFVALYLISVPIILFGET